MTDGFLNVDLEIAAPTRAQLAPLMRVFDRKLLQLFHGRTARGYRAHYEILDCATDASETLAALADTIEALAPVARRAWNAATVRDFNIGVELARGVKSVELALDPGVVRRIVALDGRIAFTAYQEAAIPNAKPPVKRRRATRR